MQKEELLKRLRLFAGIVTTVLVILIVTLLVQFGFIAYYHTEMKRLADHNTELQEEIDNLEKDIEYYTSEEYQRDKTITG